jgi:hypothetical protein
MASLSFSVDYTQTANQADPGQIQFDGAGFSGTFTASGRLDSVGDTVISPVIGPVLTPQPFNVTVEVTRTSTGTMRFVVVFENAPGGSYYYYAACDRIVKTIDNVPINF